MAPNPPENGFVGGGINLGEKAKSPTHKTMFGLIAEHVSLFWPIKAQHFCGFAGGLGENIVSHKLRIFPKAGKNHWRWPKKPDICLYKPSQIVKLIDEPENKGGRFSIPEADAFWN